MFELTSTPESFESWLGGSREACELPRGPWSPSHRHEVRVHRVDGRWQTCDGALGALRMHADQAAALHHARERARRAYADAGQPSCVKVLEDDTWQTVEVFGLLSAPAPLGAHAGWH
jgi:hypothetical protein